MIKGTKMLTKAQTAEIVAKFGGTEKNSGKSEVQVAILTAKINYLTEHFAKHKLDHHSKRGMLQKIGKRNSLLKWLKKEDVNRYVALIKALGLRK